MYHRHSVHSLIARLNSQPLNQTDGVDANKIALPYQCSLCERSFRLPSSLTWHMQTHLENDERRHACELCGSTFKRPEHLRIHMNGVHLKNKPYKCSICGKGHIQSSDRDAHERVHTRERPFECDICHKRFRIKKSLRDHMRIHVSCFWNGFLARIPYRFLLLSISDGRKTVSLWDLQHSFHWLHCAAE